MVEIIEHIDIDASPERVFRALTDPRELLAWWGDPSVCSATSWEIDARVGGRWRSHWRFAGGEEFDIFGEVLAIEPPRLLAYTWRDDRYPGVRTTTVTYTIDQTASGCRVTVAHRGFAGETADFVDYSGGWSGVLAALARRTSAG